MSKVNVQLTNRIRLAAAVLAASDWPAYEESEYGAHAVHPLAEATRQYVLDHADHPAVQQIDALLPGSLELGDLFSTAVRCNWPTFQPFQALPGRFSDGVWAEQLADFYVDTAIAAFFWADHEAEWAEAESELVRIFRDDSLVTSLLSLAGSGLAGNGAAPDVVIVPNLIYPATRTIVASNDAAYFVIVPPATAQGQSLPRSYHDSAGWVLAEACYALIPFFLEETLAQLKPEQATLLRYAVTAAFIESAGDKAAALFYRVQCKNEAGMEQIDDAVAAVQRFLSQPDEGDLVSLFSVDRL